MGSLRMTLKLFEHFAEYPEELDPCWEQTHCCCQHRPTEADQEERKEKDSDRQTGNLPGDVTGAGEAEGAEHPSADAASMTDTGRVPETQVVFEHEEEARLTDPGFQEAQQDETPKEPETTPVPERQTTGDSVRPAATETSSSSVRQRKKRRVKKAEH